MYLVKDCDLLVTNEWQGRDRGDDPPGSPAIIMMDNAKAYVTQGHMRMWDTGPGSIIMSGNSELSARKFTMNDDDNDQGYQQLILSDNARLETRNGYLRFYRGYGLVDISGNAVMDSAYHLFVRNAKQDEWTIFNLSDNGLVNADGQLRHGYHRGSVEVNISGGTMNSGDDWRMGADNDFSQNARVVVNMTAGEVNVGDDWGFPTHYEAQGFVTVNMLGGVVTVADEMYHETDDWIVNICGDGVIIIEGDHVAQILDEAENWDQTGINNHPELEKDGHWIACPDLDCRDEVVARGTLMVDYDTVNPGATTIWAELDLSQAWSPLPKDGAIDVPAQGTQLCWCPPEVDGGIKDTHVWFSTDCDAVANREPEAFLSQAGQDICIDLPCLALSTTYCWAVDIQDHYANISRGPVWTFTVTHCTMIEDFESYTLDPWSLIYKAWKDGCGVWVGDQLVGNGTGSCVNLGMTWITPRRAKSSIGHWIWSAVTTRRW
jgi:hypothetical protein